MAAAIRQLSLPFRDEPLWDVSRLEIALSRQSKRRVSVVVTDNRSVLVSFRRAVGEVTLRLHRMFLFAPLGVVRALGVSLARASRAAEGEVRRFMNENMHRVERVRPRPPRLQPLGRHYDLREVLARLNEKYFAGQLQVPITWGRGSGRARRGGITFGSYDPVLALIRIHPVLDRSDVPRHFLESVVYHEMLHHQLGGVRDRAGRTVYHTRVFRERERRYAQLDRALAWEKEYLPRLVKAAAALRRCRH